MNKPELISLPEGVPSLNTFYFYLTHGCNLACRHCWLSPEFKANGSTSGHLDFDLFKQAIDEGIPLGLNNAKLTGGEPLLHPDFVNMIDYLTEKDVQVIIETNGTLLTKELAIYLKEHSTTWFISISIDGSTAATHDRFRGIAGSFEKAINAVKYLVEAGYKPQVIMSVHEGNLHEIGDTVRMAQALGAGSVKFNLIQSTGRGARMEQRKELLDIQALIKLGKWVENDLQAESKIPLHYSWPVAFNNIKRLLERGSDSCGIFGILGVLSEGLYAMCGIGVQVPELVYGKIGVDELQSVWIKNEMLIRLRDLIPDQLEDVCGMCLFKPHCLGSCIANNYHQSNRLTAPYWFCKQAYDKGLFPKSRLNQGLT